VWIAATTGSPGVIPARRVIVAVLGPGRCDRLSASLVSLGYEVTLADSCAEVLGQAAHRVPDVILADHDFVERSGETLLAQLRRCVPSAPFVVLPFEPADTTEVVPAMPSEADARTSALAAPELMLALERVLGTGRGPLAGGARKRAPLDPFVGQSPAIRQIAEEALHALASESPILIEGETGSGKGVLAAWLHRHGPRAHKAFVDLNCAGFSRELMDSELFGHERGAFTGAVTAKPGLLEVADKGTLFLDEIGDMELPIQAKLLKVVEEKHFRRVGETRERQADVRIIAASHHDLLARVREGKFRADLYYRIHVLRMRMPALRFRSADIPALARRIITSLAQELGRPEPILTPEAESALVKHPWPGNLRELRNELERAMLAGETGPIERRHLILELSPTSGNANELGGGTLEQLERAYIERVLLEEQRVDTAAQRLGIPRSSLYQKLRALGIELPK
jgi:DNA-binding NtrC family response regulator